MTTVKAKTPVTAPISDLFFMVDKSNYLESLEFSPEDSEAILKETATQFCNTMEWIGFNLSVEDVVEDFLARV